MIALLIYYLKHSWKTAFLVCLLPPQLASFNIYIIVALPVFPQFLFTVMTFIYFRVSLAITGGHGFLFFQAAAGFFVCFCGVISRQGLI